MSRKPSYLVKERSLDGTYQTCYGTKKRYTKWRTLYKFPTLEEAQRWLSPSNGLSERSIWYKGKKVQ